MSDFFDLEMMAENQSNSVKQKPWMTSCQFILGTVANLDECIDACIASGRYALDLETSGLDSRVWTDPTGVRRTIDHIAGCGLSPDGIRGYYFPLNHVKIEEDGQRSLRACNIPILIFSAAMKRLVAATEAGKTIATFHHGRFDQEFLQFNGTGEPWGEWDKPSTWEDTMIEVYLRNSRTRHKGLKDVSKAPPEAKEESQTGGPGLGMEMIELYELYGHDKEQDDFNYDFTVLDPEEAQNVWYAGSDVICTHRLHPLLSPTVINNDTDGQNQANIYKFEKACVAATRWMERNRIHVEKSKVKELVELGQQEWFDSIMEVYAAAETLLGRDVMPGMYKALRDHFTASASDPAHLKDSQLERAAQLAITEYPDLMGRVQGRGNKSWPIIYDVNSPQQLGTMFDEMGVPGLKRTEKSKQIKTSKDELKRVIDEAGADFPFMDKIRKFREVSKALSSYLYPMLLDSDPTDDTMRINFRQEGTDTGRYSTPSKDDARAKIPGWPQINLQSLPSSADPKRPACMNRLRECITVRPPAPGRPKRYMVAIDFGGEELRLATNLSREPKWLSEFFHCSGCDRVFDKGDGNSTPLAPPARCPNCGSDKIGDLHTLTGLELYGKDSVSRPDWKSLRGHAKCVHPDTLICTNQGVHRIGLLPSQEGMFLPQTGVVWTGDSWEPLAETFGGGNKALFHLITRRGVLTCSAEHRVRIADGSLLSIETGLSKGVLLPEHPVQKILKNSPWPILEHPVFPGVPSMLIPTNAALAYISGVVLGDGTKSPSACSICHGSTDKFDKMGVSYADWQRILTLACTEAGFDPAPKKRRIYLGSRHVIRYLAALQVYTLPENTTNGTRRLRIPDWILQAGPQALYPFLGGLFDTDGTVSAKDKNLSVTTKDPVFAGHIAASLQMLGIDASFETCWNKTYQRWYFRVKVFRQDSLLFIPYMRHPGKLERLKSKGRQNKPQCGRRKSNEVLLILNAGTQQCVDLHVQSTEHLYWANGFISHNSTNFALLYGGGGAAVCKSTGVEKQEGWRIKNQFDKTYSRLKAWWDTVHRFAKQHGYVRTPFGRKYPVPDIKSEDGFFRSKAERNSVNGPVQGGGGDIIKIAMALIYKECKKRGWFDKCLLVITMHDELVFEIDADILKEAITVIVGIMTRNPFVLAQKWPIPLTTDVEIGLDWTVPWDLNAMKYKEVRFIGNKKIKDPTKCPEGYSWEELPSWPQELIPWFPEAGEDGVVATETPPVPSSAVESVEVPSIVETAAQAPVLPPSPVVEDRFSHIPPGGCWTFKLAARLTPKTAGTLAEVIRYCRGKGTRVLKLQSRSGEDLTEWVDLLGVTSIQVSPLEFDAVARSKGL